MQTLVAIFLLVIALTLFWAWRVRKISNDTLSAFAAIFTVVAGIAAIVLFLVPAASPPSLPTETSTSEIGFTALAAITEKTPTAIPANTSSLYNVEGRLLWNDEPIQGIEVKMATEGTKPFITVTDEFGRYIFSLSAGEYQLSYRFPGQVTWTSSQTTPHFSPYKYIQEPILVEEGKVTSLDDIHTMKVYDLRITYPVESGQKLPPTPNFEWEAYPYADYYQIWIYENTIYQGTPVLVPTDLQGNPGETRTTAFTFDSPLSASKDYYEVWVIAYNANGHELADYRRSFMVGE